MEEEYICCIKEKLDFMRITRIVSIDNDWESRDTIDYNADVSAFIERIHPQNIEELNRIISNKGYSTIKDVYDNDEKEIISIIEEDKQRKSKLPIGLDKLDIILKELGKNGIDVERITTYSEDNILEYTDNCLFILDKEMDDKNEDIIRKSIPKILSNADERNIKHLILAYSSNIRDEYKDNKSKLEYIKEFYPQKEENNLFVYKLFGINKGNDKPLVQELNDKLSDSIFGEGLYQYMKLEKEKTNEVYERLFKIDNEQISLMADGTAIEGNSIGECIEIIKNANRRIIEQEKIEKELEIIKIFNCYQKDKLNSMFKSRVDLEDKNNYMIFRKNKDKEAIKRIVDSDISKWEILDYSINKKYKDVVTGDIFKIKTNAKMRYIVVSQNMCDCVIRNQNGIKDVRRKTTEFMRTLELEAEDILEGNLEKLTDFESYIYPVKDDSKTIFLKNTNREIGFPQLILDICTLNENGEFKLKFDNEKICDYKNYYFEKYINSDKAIEYMKFLDNSDEAFDNYWSKVISKMENTNREDVILPDELEKDAEGNFIVKRIGRLNYSKILRINQKNYLKRINQKDYSEGNNQIQNKDILSATDTIIPMNT